MPSTDEAQKLEQTTAKGYFYQNPTPKYIYIEDPADFVYESNKNQTSQFNIPYHEMRLSLLPVFGRFSGKRLFFRYDWATVDLRIDNKNEYVLSLKPGTSPDNFIRWCLSFMYSNDERSVVRRNDSDRTETFDAPPDSNPTPLRLQCLRSVFLNMERIPSKALQCLPSDIRNFFGESSFRRFKLSLWPSYVRGKHAVLSIKRNMIVSELALLVRQKLNLKSWLQTKFYKNHLPLESDDVCGDDDDDDVIDCIITSPWSKEHVTVSLHSGPGRSSLSSQKQILVVSVVGKEIKEIQINLSLPLRFLDTQLRREFRLKPTTFLAIHLPEKRQNIIETARVVHSCYEEESAKVYVANGKRNFPTVDGKSSIPDIRELYKQNCIYEKPLCELGFHPGIFVEVFEVTGPSIPVMYFGEVTKTYVIDINPDWPIEIFLHYARVSILGASKIRSVDYMREFKEKKVQDILNMMGNLWRNVEKGSHLEYLRIRS